MEISILNNKVIKIKNSFIIVILLFLLSCNEQQQQKTNKGFSPKVVEAKGYIIPKDSMATPKSVPAGKPKVVIADKPTVVPLKTNIHLAGIPKTVLAGTPKICTPGKDSFSLPKVVQASSRTIIPGIPEMVIAKDGYSKEQNPQNFSSFTKQEGLKSNNIVCMKQDRNGNIWFGTWEGGVSRYDGKYFTHFAEKEGLAGNIVLSIYEDKSGNLWFGGGGVSKYDGKYFTQFTNIEGLVLSVFEDDSANLWFGAEKGLTKYNGKTFTNYTTKEGLSNNTVWSILEDKSGSLWFGTSGGVSRYDGKTFTHYTEKEGLSNNYVSSIYEDKAGILWFATGGGVSRYDGKTFTNYTEKEGLSNNNVSSIYEDKAGILWFGTYGGGISKYDGTTFTNFTEQDGLANNLVTSILEDRSGSLWFGIDRGGVSKYNGRTFTHFGRKEGLSSNDCASIFEDNSGNLWFGTNHGGVSKYDGKSFANFTQEDGPDNILSTVEDSYGNLWFGCFSGGVFKFKYDGKSFTHFTLKEGLHSDNVTKILQDKTGNLWVAAGGGGEGGISKYDGKTFTHYTDKEGLSSNDAWSILQDKSGNFWFGTNRGVSRLNVDDRSFTHFTAKEGLSANIVSCIIEDKSGNFWFGTDGGVSRLDRDGTTFTHFTEKEGLSNNNVQSILEDRSGNLWFGTALGLNKLSAKSLLNLSANNSSEAALIKSYTYEDGFLGLRCNHNAIFEEKNGTIWIGTEDRLTAYHPEGDKRDTIGPNLQLTGVTLFNENIPWTKLEQKKDTNIVLGNGVVIKQFQFDSLSKWYNIPQDLSLAYNNNYLTFNFVGITTKSPQKVKYQYKLEGSDENWSTLTTRNEATYGNLPPAKYTFKVRSMNSDGYWSKEVSYNFTIRPPWWKTWWAYTLYIVAFVAAVASFIAYRSRKLRLENKILEEKVSQRTIQLEQKSIELEKSLDNLKSTQTQLIQSEKMASLGELTAGIAHEIQNPLNFVNNFSEVNKEMLEELKAESIKPKAERSEQLEADLINDLIENEEKINHHGKRADAIVKGMLQHSRTSSGQREPTDINALADEYLRLAYHGLRAKDKSFNVFTKTDFDNSISEINIVPQDIGRVLLNLYNNAFYAVTEKKKLQQEGYDPVVLVSTKRINDKVEITVKDNGNGIPQKVLDKIFQPFFTTKPTGQGTGLGLSLAYDIVKAHGAEIRVETKQGEGSEFIIHLPGV